MVMGFICLPRNKQAFFPFHKIYCQAYFTLARNIVLTVDDIIDVILGRALCCILLYL